MRTRWGLHDSAVHPPRLLVRAGAPVHAAALARLQAFQANYICVWPGGRTRCQVTCSTTGRALCPGARTEALVIAGTFHPGVPMTTQLQRSRQLAYDHQGGKCYYCGLRMWLGASSGPSLLRCTAEHLLARSEGGRDDPTNIVAACLHCNQTRHKRKRPPEPQIYRAEVRRRVARGAWLPMPVLVWGGDASVRLNRAI